MITIGSFARRGDGVYHGRLHTLTLAVDGLEIRPVPPAADKAPDHRVFRGDAEIGAAWTLEQAGKPPALSVRIDDPALPAPLSGLLVEAGPDYEFRWSRPRKT